MAEWIPVTERFPKTGEYVLVRFNNNDMAVACLFERDENFTYWRAMTDEEWCVDCDTEPTHWMPLPEPPNGGADAIPAADVRPVVRGEWEWSNVDGRCVLVCSKCGSIMPTDHALDYIDAEDNHFCYWCGADMRTIGQRLCDISAEEDLFPELTAEEKAENKAEAKRMIGGADG